MATAIGIGDCKLLKRWKHFALKLRNVLLESYLFATKLKGRIAFFGDSYFPAQILG